MPAEVAYWQRQQQLVSEFGLYALACRDLDRLMAHATAVAAKGLDTPFAKVLQYRPAQGDLLVRAGVGWKPGVVGSATVEADLGSPAGFALKTGQPVVSSRLAHEDRFRTPQLLVEHGVCSAINVLIPNAPSFRGVLEVDATSVSEFTEADVAFLSGLAQWLGAAIERQQSDAALRESEERARLIIDSATDYAIFTTDPERRVTSWPPGAQAIFGWPEAEIVGQAADILFTPEDRAAGEPEREAAVARETGRAPDERWHVRKDGSRFFAEGSVRPLHAADGSLRGYLKVARDATIYRRWAERLRETEERYRLAARATNDAIWDWDLKSDHVRWNEAVQALFGYAAAEVGRSGAWWKANVHPDDRATVTARIAAVIEGAGETWSDEYRFRRADGTYADVFDRGTVIRDDAGRACRMIGAMLDLSERKRAAEALRLAEERLRMAVQSAAIGTWDYDPTSDRLRWDARCRELFGLLPDAEVSYEGAFLAGLHPEDRARTQAAVAAALDPRGPGEYDIEYRTIGLTDGVERWIRAKGKAFFDGNTATRFIGTVIDVSDRKRVEELLRDTVAQQALMMGELSHRAKNNLALIAGLLGAQGRASSHPEVRQAIAEAQARIATVAQVHDQLWRTPNLERIDLARFLRDLCSKLQETAPHHRLLYEAVPVSVPANRAVALGLVVNEMVTNAFKYAYPGGAAGEVRVSLGASGDGLRLEVADRGVGLPNGVGFTSSDKSLGARIIGSFLHQLGAKLEIVSAGAGTSFVVHVPRI